MNWINAMEHHLPDPKRNHHDRADSTHSKRRCHYFSQENIIVTSTDKFVDHKTVEYGSIYICKHLLMKKKSGIKRHYQIKGLFTHSIFIPCPLLLPLLNAFFLLPPATKFGQGNIFRSMCQEFGPQGGMHGRGHVW